MFLVRIKGFSNSGNVGTLNSCILITGSTFDVDSNIVVCLNAILEFGDRPHTAWLDKAMRYWSSMSRVAIVNSDHSFSCLYRAVSDLEAWSLITRSTGRFDTDPRG